MNQRFLMWALASIVFVVTLGISSWHEGLWTSTEPATAHRARPAAVASDDSIPVPDRPFGPEKTAPAVVPAIAAATPPPPPPPPAEAPPPPPAETPTTSSAVPDMDEEEFRAHEDRASRRGGREH